MHESTSKQRLRPSLLDRLADDERALDNEIRQAQRGAAALEASLEAVHEKGAVEPEDSATPTELARKLERAQAHLKDLQQRKELESRLERGLTLSMLRKAVVRDLGWLFNANNLGAVEALDDYPFVTRSVVNYGLPDLAGQTASGIDAEGLERIVRQAILDFEPRILPNSIKVRLMVDEQRMSHNALTFVIEGELWAEPLPVPLYLRTELDLEGGGTQVREDAGPR